MKLHYILAVVSAFFAVTSALSPTHTPLDGTISPSSDLAAARREVNRLCNSLDGCPGFLAKCPETMCGRTLDCDDRCFGILCQSNAKCLRDANRPCRFEALCAIFAPIGEANAIAREAEAKIAAEMRARRTQDVRRRIPKLRDRLAVMDHCLLKGYIAEPDVRLWRLLHFFAHKADVEILLYLETARMRDDSKERWRNLAKTSRDYWQGEMDRRVGEA